MEDRNRTESLNRDEGGRKADRDQKTKDAKRAERRTVTTRRQRKGPHPMQAHSTTTPKQTKTLRTALDSYYPSKGLNFCPIA